MATTFTIQRISALPDHVPFSPTTESDRLLIASLLGCPPLMELQHFIPVIVIITNGTPQKRNFMQQK
jgi:hypothetical protein